MFGKWAIKCKMVSVSVCVCLHVYACIYMSMCVFAIYKLSIFGMYANELKSAKCDF